MPQRATLIKMTISYLKISQDYGLKVKLKPKFIVKRKIDTSANRNHLDVSLIQIMASSFNCLTQK